MNRAEHYVELNERIIDQAVRRVIKGKKVPAADKVVSVFEPYTDIIAKDRARYPLWTQAQPCHR